MSSVRFTVTQNRVTALRNRGFDDGKAGKPRPEPTLFEDLKERAAYFQGYRRGKERREQRRA